MPNINKGFNHYIALTTDDNGCREWKGPRTKQGYGRFHLNGREIKAHRYSYELYSGPIPDGMFVCHSCDNPPCANPDHLFLGTPSDNMIDKSAKGRCKLSLKTYCKRGHYLLEGGQYKSKACILCVKMLAASKYKELKKMGWKTTKVLEK